MNVKQLLRKTMGDRLAALPEEAFRQEGAAAAGYMRNSPLWPLYTAILLFLSGPLEIDTQPLLDRAFEDGKRVFLPQVKGPDLLFFRAASPGGPWRKGPFNIREPDTDEPGDGLAEGDFPALILMPGLAFDLQGNRLGRGKGYYDRFLSGLEEAGTPYFAAGFCMEIQVIPQVSVENLDRKVGALCTAQGFFEIT